MNPDLILSSVSIQEVESQLNTLLPSMIDSDKSRVIAALSFIRQAREALSEKTDGESQQRTDAI
jgi:hypothetical protein